MSETMRDIEKMTEASYEFGFSTDLDTDVAPPGLTEETVRLISAKKDEPEWLLEWRLKAFAAWQEMEEPDWAKLQIAPIDYQSISYWAAPKQKPVLDSMDDVDPEIRDMFDKLGIPLHEQKMLSNVAVDAIVDSVSVTTTFKATLAEAGVIFCSFSEAVQDHPELVKEHLGSVVPVRDNFFAALNSAVFSDGSFCYIPKGVRCPMELSTYFRINSMNTGQFERTLIVAEDDSHVSYLEGCTAPHRDENQLHAAVVELVAKDRSEIKYSTVQNWYPGDENGVGGIYNFVTKRGNYHGVMCQRIDCIRRPAWQLHMRVNVVAQNKLNEAGEFKRQPGHKHENQDVSKGYRQVTRRDLKPQNVFYKRDSRVNHQVAAKNNVKPGDKSQETQQSGYGPVHYLGTVPPDNMPHGPQSAQYSSGLPPLRHGSLQPVARPPTTSRAHRPYRSDYAIYLLGPRYPGPPTYDQSTPMLLPMTTYVDHPGLPPV